MFKNPFTVKRLDSFVGEFTSYHDAAIFIKKCIEVMNNNPNEYKLIYNHQGEKCQIETVKYKEYGWAIGKIGVINLEDYPHHIKIDDNLIINLNNIKKIKHEI